MKRELNPVTEMSELSRQSLCLIRIPLSSWLWPLLLLMFFTPGCTHHMQYRTSSTPCHNTKHTEACQAAMIENGESYLLGFVELDDQGWLWQRGQMDTVLKAIQDEEDKQRLLIVVF